MSRSLTDLLTCNVEAKRSVKEARSDLRSESGLTHPQSHLRHVSTSSSSISLFCSLVLFGRVAVSHKQLSAFLSANGLISHNRNPKTLVSSKYL